MANITIQENDTSVLVLSDAARPETARVLAGTETGTTYQKGTLLSWNGTSDKHEVYDGTGDITAILNRDVAGETGVDKSIRPYVAGMFDYDKLIIHGGGTVAAKEEVLMQKAGMYFKKLTQLNQLDNDNT